MIFKFLKHLYRVIRRWLAPYRLYKDYHIYQRRLPELKRSVFSKEKIKVVFFPINIGMWKNDYLFQLMQKHPRFDPYIVSFFVPSDSWEFQLRNQKEMAAFFKAKGYPYIDMYNVEDGKWFDVNAFNPDIVFYTQAVDVAYPQYRIKSLWGRAVFYYIPYCMIMGYEKAGFNTLLFNISDKVFAPSTYVKDFWASFYLNKAQNVCVTGYPSFDYLTRPMKEPYFPWKSTDGRKIRLVWAPHHSITKTDVYNYSNFLLIADKMLDLAHKYEDKIDIVFKPHPRLRPKLELLESWGEKKTADYYEKWANMPNTSLEDGEYFDLFLTSDAMIHDSISFMAEYLVTGKPIMFVKKEDADLDINKYGEQCYLNHYIGHSMTDIEDFINNVVLDGKDPMKIKRLDFVHNTLLPSGDNSVAENIFNEIVKDLI